MKAALLGAVAALLIGREARAEDLALLVFGEGDAPVTALASRAQGDIVANTTLGVVSSELIPFNRSTADMRRCAGSAECFASLARGAAAFDWLLVLSASRFDADWIVSYRLIEVRADGAEQRSVGVVNPRDHGEPLDEMVTRAVAEALGDRYGDVGALRVSSTPPGAEAAIGPRTCVTPCTLERLSPGRVTVELRAQGHHPTALTSNIERSKTTELTAVLEPIEEERLVPVWAWIAAGVAAAAGGAIAIGVAANADPSEVCIAKSEASCP